jgi:hypothetical protein
MSTATKSCLAGALAALVAGPATAGELAVEAEAGYFQMAAGNSASAVFGSAGAASFGGAVRYTFWRGAFVTAGARTFSKDGERVFVTNPSSPVQKLGFPLSVRLTPVFLGVGYRLRDGKLIVPYAGVGGSFTSYTEESDVAGEAFNESHTDGGVVGFAGVEVGRGMFRVGAEAGYTSTSGAVGLAGVTRVYDEDNLGGWHVVAKVIAAF